MVAFTYRMPAGIPGSVNRAEIATVEAQFYDTTATFSGYGLPGKFASGKFVPMATGDTVASVYGFLVRPYPTGSSQDPLGVSTPSQTGGTCNVLKRGYIMVKLNGTTAAAKGGTVYIRIGNPSTGSPIGGVEAAVDTTSASNSLALPAGTYFTGPADAQGNTEIAYNI